MHTAFRLLRKIVPLLVLQLLVGLPSATAQTRITLDGKPRVESVSPAERPSARQALAADTARYLRLVRGAYHALSNDSFAVAQARFQQALKVLPHEEANAEIYYELGQLNEREGRQESALADYTRAVEANPRYLKGYLRRGGMCLLLGRTAEAIVDYDQSLRLSPGNSDALFFRALAYANAGQTQQAQHDFETLLSRDPLDERTLYSLALLESRSGKAAQALERMNGLVARFPQRSLYLATRADIEEGLGKQDLARLDWQRVVELSPRDIDYLRRAALFASRDGRRDEALRLVDRMVQAGADYDSLDPLRRTIRKTKASAPASVRSAK